MKTEEFLKTTLESRLDRILVGSLDISSLGRYHLCFDSMQDVYTASKKLIQSIEILIM